MKDKTLIPVFNPRHDFHNIIFWDTQAKEYYNKTSDMYLSADDVKFHGLPPAYANLPDVVMGPSNNVDIYGPQGTVVQVEHTADTFSVGLDDGTVLFNMYKDSTGKWEQNWPKEDESDAEQSLYRQTYDAICNKSEVIGKIDGIGRQLSLPRSIICTVCMEILEEIFQENPQIKEQVLKDLEKSKELFSSVSSLINLLTEPIIDENGNPVSDFE